MQSSSSLAFFGRCLFVTGLLGSLPMEVAARPTQLEGIYGLGGELMAAKVVSSEDLAKVEMEAPDRFYEFDPASGTGRLEAGAFDPYKDTVPFQNSGTGEGILAGTCFGMTAQASEWYQAILSEAGGDPSKIKEHRRLRRYVATDRQKRAEVLRRMVYHHARQFGRGSRPSIRKLYEDHLLPELRDPAVGPTTININVPWVYEDGTAGAMMMPHALLVYGIEGGEAVSRTGLDKEGNRAPEGSLPELRVPAVRIMFWDGNRPFRRPEDVEEIGASQHLIYYPKAGEVSFSRGDWYQQYEGFIDEYILPESAPAILETAEYPSRKANETLMQRHPTFLDGDFIVFPDIHGLRSGALRYKDSWIRKSGHQLLREEVLKESGSEIRSDAAQRFARSQPPDLRDKDIWSARYDVQSYGEAIDAAIDEHVLASFSAN